MTQGEVPSEGLRGVGVDWWCVGGRWGEEVVRVPTNVPWGSLNWLGGVSQLVDVDVDGTDGWESMVKAFADTKRKASISMPDLMIYLSGEYW